MPFGVGFTEIIIFLVVVAVLFGPSQIPKVTRSIGGGVRDFKRATGIEEIREATRIDTFFDVDADERDRSSQRDG